MHYFCINISKIVWGGGTPPSTLPPLYYKFLDPPLYSTAITLMLVGGCNLHEHCISIKVFNSGRLGVNTPKNFSPYAQILRCGRHDVQINLLLIMFICL